MAAVGSVQGRVSGAVGGPRGESGGAFWLSAEMLVADGGEKRLE